MFDLCIEDETIFYEMGFYVSWEKNISHVFPQVEIYEAHLSTMFKAPYEYMALVP